MTHDLPGGVDCGSKTVGSAEGAEVGHSPATIQEGMPRVDIAKRIGRTHDLAGVVDVRCTDKRAFCKWSG